MANTERDEYSRHDYSDMVPLKSLPNWHVAEGDPDIRGWDATDNEGNKIGQINDLIISRRTGEAAYAVLTYGGSLGMGVKHTIMPIDELRLDPSRKLVMSNYPMNALQSAPEYHDDTRDYGSFSGFWAGLAAAGAAQRQPAEHEEQPKGVVQRFVQRMEGRETEPQGEATVPIEETGQYKRRVRIHMAHRTKSGDETTLNEGDVLEIPVTGEQRVAGREPSMVDEIIIRLEAIEDEEEEREEVHHYSR